jgi:hypothetical protein
MSKAALAGFGLPTLAIYDDPDGTDRIASFSRSQTIVTPLTPPTLLVLTDANPAVPFYVDHYERLLKAIYSP